METGTSSSLMEFCCGTWSTDMTVKELMEALQQMPENLMVIFPDYYEVTKVLRVVDPALPWSIGDTVVLTDEGE